MLNSNNADKGVSIYILVTPIASGLGGSVGSDGFMIPKP